MRLAYAVCCAFALVASPARASDTYRETAAFGYSAAARILGGAIETGDVKNVRVRVSLSPPLGASHEQTVTIPIQSGSAASFDMTQESERKALAFFKTPYDPSPILQVSIGYDGGRNTLFADAFVHLVAGRLTQIPPFDLRTEKDDGATRASSPMRFKDIWKLESGDERLDRVGGSTIWHNALYRVTTPQGVEEILHASTPIRDEGADAGPPDPHPTPFIDAPLDGRVFCLWRDAPDAGPARPFYYAPC